MYIRLCHLHRRKASLIETLLFRGNQIKKRVESEELIIEELLSLSNEMKHISGFLHYYYLFNQHYKVPNRIKCNGY